MALPHLSTVLYVLLALDAVAFAGGIAFVFLSPKTDAAGEGMKWLLPVMLAAPLLAAGLLALLGFVWSGFRVAGVIIAAAPLALGLYGMVRAPFDIAAERGATDPARNVAEGFAAGPARDFARAVMAGDEAAARRLLAAGGIDPRAADAEHNTLFVLAVVYLPALVPDLVRGGADPNHAAAGTDPPIFAALRGSTASFAILLDHGADPDARDRQGTPILAVCLILRRADAAEALLARGVDIHARDADNWSLAMYAVAYQHWAIAEALIRGGVDLDEPRGDGETFATMFARARQDRPADEAPAIGRVVAAAAERGVTLR